MDSCYTKWYTGKSMEATENHIPFTGRVAIRTLREIN